MSKYQYSFEVPSATRRLVRLGALVMLMSVAFGCSADARLSKTGETQNLNAIENPTTQPGYKPVQMPMPKPEVVSYNANSLWRNGSPAFFKEQRRPQTRRIPTRHRPTTPTTPNTTPPPPPTTTNNNPKKPTPTNQPPAPPPKKKTGRHQ